MKIARLHLINQRFFSKLLFVQAIRMCSSHEEMAD